MVMGHKRRTVVSLWTTNSGAAITAAPLSLLAIRL